LTTLASELRDAQTRDWRWWQLARHAFTGGREVGLAVGLVSGPVFGLVLGVEFGLEFGLKFGLKFGLVVGLVVGLIGGLMVGLVVGLVFGLLSGLVRGLVRGPGLLAVDDRNAPAHADFRLRGRARALGSKLVPAAVGSMAGGLSMWLIVVVLTGPPPELMGLLVIALAGTLGYGLVLGLINFAASPSIARGASSPTQSQRGDRRLTVLATSVGSLVIWVAIWVVSGPGLGAKDALAIGIACVLAVGAMTAPVIETCWLPFLWASLLLAARHRLPFRLMEFLDDMYRLGLLRIVGPVYQFRHAALQDHLAPPR
jgi:hypothetical protein